MTHPSTERLSEYLDGELDVEAERDTAAHLAGCPNCADLLAELRRVLVRAQALEDRPPRDDLWPGVAAAIGAAPPRRWRVQVPVPLLVAAGLALLLLSGTVVTLLLRSRTTAVAVIPPRPASADSAFRNASVEDPRGYDVAVKALSEELAENAGNLDSTTVRIVQQKLALIDRAIAEAEKALQADPANSYLHGHLTHTRLRKLDLLRRAATIGRAQS
jgi:hypothetical protein